MNYTKWKQVSELCLDLESEDKRILMSKLATASSAGASVVATALGFVRSKQLLGNPGQEEGNW